MKDNTNMNDVLLKTPIFTVVRGREVQPNFRPILVKSPDWVSVVVEKDGMFLMEKQHRYGLDKVCEEFPCGMIEENEAPIKAALRELVEETGYSAQKLTHLSTVSPNPAIMRNVIHFYVAENLVNTGLQNLDKDEFINCIIEPVEETLQKMGHGQYSHALTSTALFLYMQKFAKNVAF